MYEEIKKKKNYRKKERKKEEGFVDLIIMFFNSAVDDTQTKQPTIEKEVVVINSFFINIYSLHFTFYAIT